MENENPKYTLHYFSVHVKAEAMRMLLAHAKVPFKDRVINQATEWPEVKQKEFAGGQVPILDCEDGSRMTQSTAILRFLGKTHGYYPEDAKAAYEVDRAIDDFNEVLGIIYKPHFVKDYDSAPIFEKVLPTYLTKIEKQIQACTTKFLFGDKPTIADFAIG